MHSIVVFRNKLSQPPPLPGALYYLHTHNTYCIHDSRLACHFTLAYLTEQPFETTVLTLRKRTIHLIVITIMPTMFQRHMTKHLYNVTDFKMFSKRYRQRRWYNNAFTVHT